MNVILFLKCLATIAGSGLIISCPFLPTHDRVKQFGWAMILTCLLMGIAFGVYCIWVYL